MNALMKVGYDGSDLNVVSDTTHPISRLECARYTIEITKDKYETNYGNANN